MRITGLGGALAALMALASCGSPDPQQTASHHGRYLGIGVYSAGEMWSRIIRSGRAADPAAATTADDEHVIVVVDSHTGEVRQCGNLTGHCIGLNPWRSPLGAGQATPVNVSEHAADLDRESAEAENTAQSDADAPAGNAQSR